MCSVLPTINIQKNPLNIKSVATLRKWAWGRKTRLTVLNFYTVDYSCSSGCYLRVFVYARKLQK